MSSFCSFPWRGLMMTETGELRPCCKLDTSKIPNWQTSYIKDGLDTYSNNLGLLDLKQSFLAGDKPDACHKCWTPESHGMYSHRQLLDVDYSNDGFGRFDLSLGNLCNLKCRICHPSESSRYINEWYELFGEKKTLHNTLDQHTLDMVSSIASKSDVLNIYGGEPMLIREHLDILRYVVANNRAGETSLQYHTNGTIYPDPELLDLWSKFKSIELSFSLDGIGKVFEYNRHPAKWKTVESNILRLKENLLSNLKIRINTVLSIFTIDALEDLFNWTNKNEIEPPHILILTNPPLFRVSVLPLALKQELKISILKQKHLKIKAALGTLDNDDSHLLPALRHRLNIQDQYRREVFAEVFPRIAAHVFG